MVRKLKYHEQRLLRKVDFITYKSDQDHRAAAVIRRYAIQKPSDYTKYNRLCGSLRQLAHKLANLDSTNDIFRRNQEEIMLEKLFGLGVIGSGGGGRGKLSDIEHISVSAFARRRLGVLMVKLSMADNVQAAVKFIEQGHVRVGTEVMTDPAFLVTRNMEDFVTWVDSSKIKASIRKYRSNLDDFDLL